MDALTREQYTSPWWTTHGDNSDGPSALVETGGGDHDLVTARRRRELRDAERPQPGDASVDEAGSV